MVFSSPIFLWIFLPAVFAAYYILPVKFRNPLLLIASLIFYAWGEPRYIVLMLFSVCINYSLALLMEKTAHKKSILVLDIVINLLLLGYFKYFNFLAGVVGSLFGFSVSVREIALPIGISFYTFQILSYIIDLYRGQYKAQRNIIDLALYISFFPQLIAGPIVRYKDIDEQLSNRICTREKCADGIRRFIYGLGKKVIVANLAAQYADSIFSSDAAAITGGLAWFGAILYTLQIYYDFSGYSDMAIGLGKMFGFEFTENFRYPYLSRSVREFWQRWHISLGTWFREYLYIPLGGNRKGSGRTYLNLLTVFFVTGLWHGAGYTFILWGLWHGLFQIIERLGFLKFLEKHRFISHLYTCLVFVFGWVLFRAESVSQALMMFTRMIMPWAYTGKALLFHQLTSPKMLLMLSGAVLGCGVVQKLPHIGKLKNTYIELIYCAGVFVLCMAMLAANTYNPFIYFRF
ncbi:MAG: MBOAT family O-acyltransferase [Eubacteriales bacterium]|nr:MBOAT family O-acyltransferase [Eubacteriales bacterium]